MGSEWRFIMMADGKNLLLCFLKIGIVTSTQ